MHTDPESPHLQRMRESMELASPGAYNLTVEPISGDFAYYHSKFYPLIPTLRCIHKRSFSSVLAAALENRMQMAFNQYLHTTRLASLRSTCQLTSRARAWFLVSVSMRRSSHAVMLQTRPSDSWSWQAVAAMQEHITHQPNRLAKCRFYNLPALLYCVPSYYNLLPGLQRIRHAA